MEKYVPSQPEIVRSNQKDEDSLDHLISHCHDALHTVCGPSVSLRWRREVKVVCYLSYLLFTTGSGRQTLGEEYANVILFDPVGRDVPSGGKRVGVAALQALFPYLSTVFRIRWSNKVNEESDLEGSANEEWDSTAMEMSEMLDVLVRHLPTLHLSLFYIGGKFYHFGKRLLNVQYLRSVPGGADQWTIRLYSLVGLLLLIKSACSMVKELRDAKKRTEYERRRRQNRHGSSRSLPVAQWSSRCPLCLEVKCDPTVAPCGHTFCWECIVGYSMRQSSPSCPICRQSAPTNRLVYLVNYSDD